MFRAALASVLALSCSPAPTPESATAEVVSSSTASADASGDLAGDVARDAASTASAAVTAMPSSDAAATTRTPDELAEKEVALQALPDQPASADVEKVLASAAASMNRCAGSARGTVKITIQIGGDGRALTAFDGSEAGGTLLASDGVNACFSVVLEDLAWPQSKRGLTLQRVFTIPMKAR